MNIKVNVTRVPSVFKHIKKAEYKIWTDQHELSYLVTHSLLPKTKNFFFLKTPIYWSKDCFVEL